MALLEEAFPRRLGREWNTGSVLQRNAGRSGGQLKRWYCHIFRVSSITRGFWPGDNDITFFKSRYQRSHFFDCARYIPAWDERQLARSIFPVSFSDLPVYRIDASSVDFNQNFVGSYGRYSGFFILKH